MLRRFSPLLLLTFLALSPAVFAVPRVVVDVPPVHSLVAAVMAGVGRPQLLISGGRSPHDYALRPSDAQALAGADVIIWVGEGLDGMLTKPIASLGASARVLELLQLPGIERLPLRHGGVWSHDTAEHGALLAGAVDPHLWLDPGNARRIVVATAALLAAADPADAARYRANAAETERRIAALQGELARQLAPVRQRPFVVFHDAYHYFDHAFGLQAVGALSIDPEQPPGARRLLALRSLVQARGAICVFSEPQFPSPLLAAITDGTTVGHGVLDPLGAALQPGPDLWFELMRDLANNLTACLSPQDHGH